MGGNGLINKLLLAFGLAFVLNFIWEYFHSFLYLHYRGGAITMPVLLGAAIFDASFLAGLALLFYKIEFFKKRLWTAWLIAIVFALILERYALLTNRWAYNELMPVVPIFETGLTPTIQLAVLFYVVFRIVGAFVI